MAQSEGDEPALFMVTASVLPDVPNFDSKSTEVIDDGITAPVSVELEEELPKSTEVINDSITALVSVEPKEELPKSTGVIDDGITALVSVEPEEDLQLCITKAPAGEPIQLKKERVFAQIGGSSTREQQTI